MADTLHIEDIYELSPMQQGMLFHTVHSPDRSAYIEQNCYTLTGHFDVRAFRSAWQLLVNSHSVLRTALHWEDIEQPVQVVFQGVSVQIEMQDWRELSAAERDEDLEKFLAADRENGFALSTPPLMRWTILRIDEHKHYFVWTHHHALLDGWSGSILLGEVFAAYHAIQAGNTPRLFRRRPFGDYIEWLRDRDHSRAESFWRRLINGFSAPTPLGTTAPDTLATSDSSDIRFQTVQLSPELTQHLQAFVRQLRVTLNTLLQCAWAVELSRWSGHSDIVFGATVSGRSPELDGAESIIGLLINTLPIRVHIRDGITVGSLLREIQMQAVEARQFEYTPLVDIHRWSEVPGWLPLFESVLIYENFPQAISSAGESSRLKITGVRNSERTSFPLALIVSVDLQLQLKIIYDGRRFDGGTVERLLGRLITLLKELAADSQRCAVEVPHLSSAEGRLLLEKAQDDKAALFSAQCVHHIFEQQVCRTPSAPAVTYGDATLSYQELNVKANQLAHYLCTRGVGPDLPVGIFLDRSLEMIVGILAILKAGGAYVPLDPSYPQERISFMLRDIGAGVLLTTAVLRASLPVSFAGHVVLLDQDADVIARESSAEVFAGTTPENLAYIIYTSGSSGRPKGVMLSHAGLARVMDAQILQFGIYPDSRTLQFSSPSFDACTSEIFTTLLGGAHLCLAPRSRLYPGESLAALMSEQKITVVTLPPSALAVTSCEGLSSLQTVISAGEACSPAVISRWSRNIRFLNAYGPTEATICATMSKPLMEGEVPVIGQVIPHAALYLLDQHLQWVGIECVGEIYIAGETLARGYINCPDLTAERFIPDPFSSRPGARMYRTGDLARYLSNGDIVFIGRSDHQVKVRGFRIELGEIEAVLGLHPELAQCAVTVREDTRGDRALVAYFVSCPGRQPTSAALRSYLQEMLPEYMVPNRFLPLSTLPLTPNGKVDRAALPSLESVAAPCAGHLAPRTEMERLVASIWCEVLDVKKVSLQDNFFDLGGHSLKMIRIHARLQAALGRKISMVDLFMYPTAGALARFLTEGESATETFDDERQRATDYIRALRQYQPKAVELKEDEA
ncbi:MAG TPA: amino acid adenylation domain-containing protein [Candidatus Angelobacter sp.]|jgi:amino acid adenylation domain-containing protein|nr:amino acid adenylation domain-containing protein [Candidatus Angelobacter sp.]